MRKFSIQPDFSHLFSNLTTLQWDSPLSFSQHAFLLCLRSDFCLFKSFKCWKKKWQFENACFWDEWLNCLEQLESMKMMPSAAFTFIFILLQQLSFYFLFHQKSALTHKCKDQQRAVLLISSEHRPLWAGRVSENEMRKAIFTLISLCIFISFHLLQLKQCLLKGKLASLFTLHSNDVLFWKSRCSNEDAVCLCHLNTVHHTQHVHSENETSFPFSF